MGVLRFLFSFYGRVRRRDWWLTRLGVWGVFVGAAIAGGLFAEGLNDEEMIEAAFRTPAAVLLPIAAWIDVAVSVKRLHDRDLTGWLYLAIFIPILGGLFALIFMGCLDGTPGPNRHGDSPKYPDLTRDALFFE